MSTERALIKRQHNRTEPNQPYSNRSEGRAADSVGGKLRQDKECLEFMIFSGVTSSGRVWRKVPESDARSVCVCNRVVQSVLPMALIAVGLSHRL